MARNPAEMMRQLGSMVKKEIPKGYGYALIVIPFNEAGRTDYISSCNRGDMIVLFREVADSLEDGKELRTPEEIK